MRTVHFPKERSVGVVYVRDANSNQQWEKFGEAKGDVNVPAGKEWGLEVAAEASKDLSWLAALKGDDLKLLALAGADVNDSKMRYVAGLTTLESLWLQNCPVGDSGLAQIKSLKSLKQLVLFNTQCHGRRACGSWGLPSITSLNCHKLKVGKDGSMRT